jgi:hypothetical protein
MVVEEYEMKVVNRKDLKQKQLQKAMPLYYCTYHT